MPESQAFALQSTTEILRNKFDCALLRHDAWWLVFIAVLIGLGATSLLVWPSGASSTSTGSSPATGNG